MNDIDLLLVPDDRRREARASGLLHPRRDPGALRARPRRLAGDARTTPHATGSCCRRATARWPTTPCCATAGSSPRAGSRRGASFDSPLGHHPDRTLVPGVEISSGSLGHGLPLAVGTALGLRAQGIGSRVVVLVGDAELDEGSNHEALELAAALGLDSLTLVVVDNRSSSYAVPGRIAARLATEGWQVATVDGRDQRRPGARPDRPCRRRPERRRRHRARRRGGSRMTTLLSAVTRAPSSAAPSPTCWTRTCPRRWCTPRSRAASSPTPFGGIPSAWSTSASANSCSSTSARGSRSPGCDRSCTPSARSWSSVPSSRSSSASPTRASAACSSASAAPSTPPRPAGPTRLRATSR